MTKPDILPPLSPEADAALFHELEPVAGQLLDRHLGVAKEWFPYKLVPWSEARDLTPDEVWDPKRFPLPEEVRAALHVNLLTEEGLPYYSFHLLGMFGLGGAFGEWGRQWTAEEGRHAKAIDSYVTVTRAIDPVALERGRMHYMKAGATPQPSSKIETGAYVALQELATRVSHLNTGAHMPDEHGKAVMDRVAKDENLHYLFYKDIVAAAIKIDPELTLQAIDRQVRGFAMPGTAIDNFKHLAQLIASAGIYNLGVHYDKVLEPVIIKAWGIDKIHTVVDLSPDAQAAQESILSFMAKSARVAARFRGRNDT